MRAFSIVELAVSTAVVAILLILVTGALRAARDEAQSAESVGALRSLSHAVIAYADDHGSMPPSFRSPADPEVFIHGRPQSWQYFHIHWTWHHLLAPTMDGTHFSDPIFHPADRRYGEFPLSEYQTSYFLACSFSAQPDFWNVRSRRFGTSQLRPVSLARVRFTSDKSLMIASWPFTAVPVADQDSTPLPVAFVDGSAASVRAAQRIAGYPFGDGAQNIRYGARHMGDYPPMMHTIDGVLGRDRNATAN